MAVRLVVLNCLLDVLGCWCWMVIKVGLMAWPPRREPLMVLKTEAADCLVKIVLVLIVLVVIELSLCRT